LASNADHGSLRRTPAMRFSKRRIPPKQIVAECLGYATVWKALLSLETPMQVRGRGRWLIGGRKQPCDLREGVFGESILELHRCLRVWRSPYPKRCG